MKRSPKILTWRAKGPVRAVVLVLHGGAEAGLGWVSPWNLPYRRMRALARGIRRAVTRHGVEVRLLRNRVLGWNEPALHPIADARWALEQIRDDWPGVRILLVGHSMGGRVALRVADDPAVTGVFALAPWTPRGEAVEPVRGRDVMIAHGSLDLRTSPAESYAYARRAESQAARIVRFQVLAEGHAMLVRSRTWTRLVRRFVLDGAGVEPARAWAAGPGRRLRQRV
ncbi:MAG TPA: alpha/beta fold hydrolase [Amycolatopsis sp.]|uniref:alpha/beta hydrolase n=1 Tax=Amycolatopsis sp. TaxID=37632 RepID=UPI002B48603A|nr:alpha/beta fold hydrolase [Amycolatopsis sp.]HKS49926.1 alpha/beta fold hydrolase [Amycolatopsis sp.]